VSGSLALVAEQGCQVALNS